MEKYLEKRSLNTYPGYFPFEKNGQTKLDSSKQNSSWITDDRLPYKNQSDFDIFRAV